MSPGRSVNETPLPHPLAQSVGAPSLRETSGPESRRVLLTGATSIHGWPLLKRLQRLLPPGNLRAVRPPGTLEPRGENIIAACVTDRACLLRVRDGFRPTHVVHAAGVCDLDVCEERPRWARAINSDGCRTIAEVFGPESWILHMSSDLVFSGNNPPAGGYAETDAPDPVSVAGRTIAEGERHIAACPRSCILRLGLPLGDSITGDKGAMDWISSRLRRGRPVTLFHDEWRSCITTDEVAEIAVRFLDLEATGVFHCGGPRAWSLHEVGLRAVARGGFPAHLLTSISRFEEKDGPPRIGNVALDSSKLRRRLGCSSAGFVSAG